MSEANTLNKLSSVSQLDVRPRSVVSLEDAELGIAQMNNDLRLAIVAPAGSRHFEGFKGNFSTYRGQTLLLGPTSASNAATLRSRLRWLRPRTLGLRTSVGLGDRLGLATPGHVRAVRAAGSELAPIFPQQSIREMERTDRSAQQVMDDATWGVFVEGWRAGFGADADHLKTPEDIDQCVAAGYTFFTFDPGEHVDNSVENLKDSALRRAVERLPWARLEDSAEELLRRYVGRSFDFEGHCIRIEENTIYRAALKYGNAVAHVAAMYRHLSQVAGDREFEVEISVDETATPTTHAQHVYIANELRRLEVRWLSLAPRYVGEFEKGVDYIGNIEEFEADLAVHAAIARSYGPYKLSLHSGSDKYSVYPACMRQTRGLVHLKTAGTSYLEALRAIAILDPDLFREIYAFARESYTAERASYHVSAAPERAPMPQDLSDEDLSSLVDQFDARQILHVTFGSVLRAHSDDGQLRFHNRLVALLRANRDTYAAGLEAHFAPHLEPFAKGRAS